MCLGMKQLRARLTPRTSIMLKSRTQSGYSYFMYVVQVPYIPNLRSYFNKVLMFLKNKNMQRALVEKTDVQWVTLSMLKNLEKRSVFAGTLEMHAQAIEDIATSPVAKWRDLCDKHSDGFDAVFS